MKRGFLISAVAFASLTGPAIAQETGTRVGATVHSGGDSRLVYAKIGACMVRDQPRIVSQWLDIIPGTTEEAKFIRSQEPRFEVCMERGDDHLVTVGELIYYPDELRRYIGLAAGRQAALGAPATSSFKPDMPGWYEPGLAALGPQGVFDKTVIVRQDFGHCVILANWGASRDMLRSDPGSSAESAAVAALVPSLGPCIVAGAKVDLTRFAVRTALSEPFYHLTTMVRASSTGTH